MNILKVISKRKKSVHELLESIPQDAIFNLLDNWGCSPVYKEDGIIAKCPNHIYHAGHDSTHTDKFKVFESGYTNCFTGSHSDNILNIAAEIWHCDIEEAYKRIANGVNLHKDFGYVVIRQDTEKERRELEAKRIRVLDNNLKWLSEQIRIGRASDECIEYFAKDGIEKDTLDFFHITSIENNWWKYQGRAIIPFFKSKHDLCGFIAVSYKSKEWQCENMASAALKIDGSRTLDEYYKIAWEKYKKVWYCPGFTSRNHLFGRYEAMSNFSSWDELMIVEGERDCMKMIQEGIPCVAIHGTTIKQEQLAMLQSMKPDKIYLGLDMDTAGREGCRRAQEQLTALADDIRILEFPEGKDPKKFNGREMRTIINNGGVKM